MKSNWIQGICSPRKSFSTAFFMILFSMASVGVCAGTDINSSVSISQVYDDNLFRIDSEVMAAQQDSTYSDVLTKAEVDFGSSMPVGRQVFQVGLGLAGIRYQRNEQLNKALYNAQVGALWQLGSQLSGAFQWRRNSDVLDFSEQESAEDNSILTNAVSANVLWKLSSGFDLGFNASESLSENSLTVREIQDLKSLSSGVSLNYSSGGKSRLGLSFQTTRGIYPNNAALVNTNLVGYVSDLSAINYETTLTGKSSFSASVGIQSRSNSGQISDAHSGDNINLNYQWVPTGKLQFSFGWYKNNSTSLSLQASSYDTNGVTLSSGYRLSEKVSLSVDVKNEQKQYFATGTDGKSIKVYKEDDSEFGVSVNYKPIDKVSMGLTIRNSFRDSSRILNDYQSQMWLFNVKVDL